MAYFLCRNNFTRVGAKLAVCLSSGTWSQQTPVCVARGCPDLGSLPDVTVTEEYDGGVLHFDCAAGMRRQGPQSLMCDGVKWNGAPPKCLYGISLGCDFEDSNLCGWTQDINDDFDWTWTSGTTPTTGTGPEGDHTTGKGHYIYMESSAPQKLGWVTRLISPPYGSTEELCLSFFYHMQGPDEEGDVGDLDVYVRTEDASDHPVDVNIFHQEGNQGTEWLRGNVVLPRQQSVFSIVFAATRRESWTSDIALDDISVFKCSERHLYDPRDNPDKTEIPLQTEIMSREATHLTEAPMTAYDALLDMYDPSGTGEWMPGSNNDIGSGENGGDNNTGKDITTEMTTEDVISAITTDMTTKDVVTTDMTTKDDVSTEMTTKHDVTTDMTTKDVVTTDMTTKHDITTDMTTKDDVTIDMTTKDDVSAKPTQKTESPSKADLQHNIFQFQFQFLYFFNLKGSKE